MLDKLQAIYDRYQYLEEQISDPDVVQDMDRYRKINKEYKDLQPVVDAFLEYRNVLSNLDLARFTLQEDDPEMQELAREEIALLSPRLKELEESLKTLLIPKDPEDSKDVIFEIRSGTGGDEASLFAGDLYRMYTRYFDSKGWKTEVLEVNEGSVGGYNKVVLEVQGEDVFGKLKFESGAHRVQRVPKTESQGRVHTSAATVVVMPKLEMEDVEIRKDDLKAARGGSTSTKPNPGCALPIFQPEWCRNRPTAGPKSRTGKLPFNGCTRRFTKRKRNCMNPPRRRSANRSSDRATARIKSEPTTSRKTD